MNFKDKFTLTLLTLSALAISGAAAFFSVYGLSKVFAGAGVSVIIMASILEASKIITAYALHQNTKKLPTGLKSYLTIAVIVLMIITSAGIYGFLSNAYQITANKNTIVEKEIAIVQAKIDNKNERLEDLLVEKKGLVSDMNNMRQGLSAGTSIESVDRRTGLRVVSRDASIARSLNSQLGDATQRRNKIDQDISTLSASIDSLKISILEKQSNNDAAAELGPIIYLSKITNLPMDNLMNYFILMIVFVFDPLAISLVLALSHISVYNSQNITTTSIVEEQNNGIEPENVPEDLNNSEDTEGNKNEVILEPGEQVEGTDNLEDGENTLRSDITAENSQPELQLYEPSDNTEDPALPKLKIKTIKKEIPGFKIVDNGQKVPDIKEVEEIVIVPEDQDLQTPLSADEYARLLDKYIAQMKQMKETN